MNALSCCEQEQKRERERLRERDWIDWQTVGLRKEGGGSKATRVRTWTRLPMTRGTA